MSANPVLVNVYRGEKIESMHRGAVAVVDAKGELKASWGDVEALVYVRSAMKPFQAMTMVMSGAVEHFKLTDEHIALHCASHNGEQGHTSRVGGWLDQIGLSESDLECGPQTPYWAMHDMQRAFEAPKPSPICNNCSGKHTGFLTTARQLGAKTSGYIHHEHPVQQKVRQLLSTMTDVDEQQFIRGSDGCSAPVYALPLKSWALGFARLADPSNLPDAEASAARRIVAAMRAHPWLVAGSKRVDTQLMQDPAFNGIAKVGAEAVYGMALPDCGLGVVVKIDDGAERAAGVAAAAVLHKMGLLGDADLERLQAVARPIISNWAGVDIGVIEAADLNC